MRNFFREAYPQYEEVSLDYQLPVWKEGGNKDALIKRITLRDIFNSPTVAPLLGAPNWGTHNLTASGVRQHNMAGHSVTLSNGNYILANNVNFAINGNLTMPNLPQNNSFNKFVVIDPATGVVRYSSIAGISALQDGSGTTFSTNKYNLGGALTVDADITGASSTLDVRLGTSVDGLGHFEVNSVQGDQRYLSSGFGLTVVDNPGGRKSQVTTAGSTTSYEINPGYFGVDYSGAGGTSSLRISEDYVLTTNDYTVAGTNHSLSPTAGSTTVTDGTSTALITIGAGTHVKTLSGITSTNTINRSATASILSIIDGAVSTTSTTNAGQLSVNSTSTAVTGTSLLDIQPVLANLSTENTTTNAKGSLALGQLNVTLSYTDGSGGTASLFQDASVSTMSQALSGDPTIGLTLNQSTPGAGFTYLYGYNTNITLGATSSIFTDNRVGALAVGFEYNADYSANFTPRSLVDKAYVDALIVSGVTASNGLTEVASDIQLGGALTKDADITGATNSHDVRLGTSTDGLGTFEVNATTSLHLFSSGAASSAISTNPGNFAVTVANSSSNTQSTINTANSSTSLRAENTTGNTEYGEVAVSTTGSIISGINPTTFADASIAARNTTGILLPVTTGGSAVSSLAMDFAGVTTYTDSHATTPTGIQYAADYSGTYTARSLVDKAYVDAQVIAGVTASNGLTEVGSDIRLGGLLASNTRIWGAHELDLGYADPSTENWHLGSNALDRFSVVTSATGSPIPGSSGYIHLGCTVYTDANNHVATSFEADPGSIKMVAISRSSGTDIQGTINLAPSSINLKSPNSSSPTTFSQLAIQGDLGTTFTDSSNNQEGIRYAADYSSNYVDRSLIDKAYATGLISAAAGNGLTETAGVINLGGTLTADVTIDGNQKIYLGGASSFLTELVGFADTISLLGNFTNNELLTMSGGTIALRVDGSGFSLTKNASTFIDTGSIGAGLEYAADYSSNYTSRSLIDLAHANTLITAVNTIFTGGTMSAPSTITMATNSVTFSGGAVFVDDIKINSDHIDNTFIGKGTGNANVRASSTSGAANTFVGAQAGETNISGYAQAAFGYNALQACNTGGRNTAIGYQTLASLTTGDDNTALGVDAGASIVANNNNVAIGFHTMSNFVTPSTGDNNVFVGNEIAQSLTSGGDNSVFGHRAAFDITTGYHNTLIGALAGFNITTGNLSTIVGSTAGQALTTEVNNTMIGYHAGQNTTSSYNTMVGNDALLNNVAGSSNTALGNSAGALVSAGTANTSSTQSTFLGGSARALVAGGSNEIVVGYNTIGHGTNTATYGSTLMTDHYFHGNVNIEGFGATSGTNSLTIHNSTGSSNSLIVRDDGNVGVGEGNPLAPLHVSGITRVDNSSAGSTVGLDLYNNTIGGNNWISVDFSINSTKYASIQGGYGPAEPELNFIVGNVPVTKMTIKDSGNVGIGTSSPSERLEVTQSGTASVDVIAVFGGLGNGNLGGRGTAIDIQVPGNGSQEEGVRLIAETKGGQTVTQSADFVVQTAKIGTLTERLRLTTDGDLGLGIAIPTARMHVQGNGASSATTTALFENSVSANILTIKDDGNVGIGVNAATPPEKLTVDGSIGFSYTTLGSSANGFRRTGILTEYYNVITSTGTAAIHQFTGNGTTIMTLLQGGNIGVGTATPTGLGTAVEIEGTAGASYNLTAGGVNNNFATIYSGTTINDPTSIFSSTGFKFAIASDNLATGFSEKMRLTVGGDLGLGYTVPEARLHVRGSGATSATKTALFENSSGTDILTIRDNGNVGVGISTPSAPFHFLGTKMHLSGTGSVDSNYSYFKTELASSNKSALTIGTTFGFSTDVDAMTVYNGDVIIGAAYTSIAAKLHVQGNGATSVTTALLVENSAGTNSLEVKDDGGVYIGVTPNTASGVAQNLVRNPSTGEIETSGSGIIQAKISLSNAQLLAINSSPVTLVGAPGSGKVNFLHSAMIKVVPNTTVETTQATQPMVIGYTITGPTICSMTTDEVAWGTATELLSNTVTPAGAMNGADNGVLAISGDNGNFVEFDGTMEVYITYEEITL